MLAYITGKLASATPLAAVIDVHGLGYLVHIPVTTAEKLPRLGDPVKLHTHVIYREDAQTLYGFATPEERDFFRLMIENVSGIGPKLAITIMSKLSVPMLETTIRDADAATLSKCPGIGKKTAERLVIELRGKIPAFTASATPVAPAAVSASAAPRQPAAQQPAAAQRHRDAVLALSALGYKPSEADEAVRRAAQQLDPDASTEQLIKKAFNT
ncbi:MAG: Holliday junction branch migration protein RuvA [Opitutaceae bacterium]|jgi:Holliday junction DNA helicase RuvA|nr:Holliday junction branch migration protein RuvA [Opitutaceae bacterium]